MCKSIRISLALLATLALSITAGATRLEAQNTGSASAKVEHFTFTAPQAPLGPVDPAKLRLSVHRWATDTERDALVQGVSERGHERLLDVLRDSGVAGYVQWPGGLEYAVRYARRTARADGGQDIVLVLDRPLWVWWKTELTGNAAKHPFEVVAVRIDRSGQGEGRVADPSAITTDKSAGIALANSDSQPVVMTEVQRDTRS